ncbi:MAG TPA: hypothetical protein VM555_05560 [Tahibacter sp.]|nr:hypothetical protein [Tahibacter sp.]
MRDIVALHRAADWNIHMRSYRFAVSLVFCAALAACATTIDRPASSSPSSHAQGSVAGERVDESGADRYAVQPGERYEQPLAHIDNSPPVYPAALLPLALPPRFVTARLAVDANGRVTEASPVDLAATPGNEAMFASVRDAVLQWRFFPLVKIVAGPGKTTLRTFDVETTYDGKATPLPFSEVYKFTFTQAAGVGSVDSSGR